MIATFVLTATLSLNTLSFAELESAWWDCDTKYQQDNLINREYLECRKIDEEFRLHFVSSNKFLSNEDVFLQYWNDAKKDQWAKRGYKQEHEHDD
jgi:hypothetical protein